MDARCTGCLPVSVHSVQCVVVAGCAGQQRWLSGLLAVRFTCGMCAGLDLSDEEGNPSEKLDSMAESGSDSDSDLPPIQRIQNRRVVEYEVSQSDSEEE